MQDEVDNSWYEKGKLPPVGFNVQITMADELNNLYPDLYAELNGEEVKIISHRGSLHANEDVAVFECMIDDQPRYHAFVANCFRPIKSDREKAIEAALKPILSAQVEIKSIKWASDIAGNLYDAGLLRLPEDK